jgi:lipoprotein-releasing system permease protein
LDFARRLLEYESGEVTSVEVRLDGGADYLAVQAGVRDLAGGDFEVKNRYQQQALLYRIMKSEKWAIFFILTFILIIAAFNVIGSISMLILDKRKDIAILSSMGASEKLIKRIFLTEGMFVSLFGALSGILLGAILCFLQLEFGLIRLGDANAFIVPYYPVKMELLDFVAVFFTVIAIGVLSAWYPVKQISSRYLHQRVTDFTRNQ